MKKNTYSINSSSKYKYLIISILTILACNSKTTVQTEKKVKTDSFSTQNLPKPTTQTRLINPQDSMPIKYPTLVLENYAPSRSFLQQKLSQEDSVKIICYGNSITRGYKVGSYSTVEKPYPQTLEKLLQNQYKNPKIRVINEGHNGWRSDQGQVNLAKLVIAQKPDWVILEFGINDAYSNFSNQLYQAKMQLIIHNLQKNNISILLCSPTPILSSYNAKLLEYSQILLNLAKQYKVNFLHWHQIISQRAEKNQVRPQDLLPDEVHFADDKYQWLAEAIGNWLAE